MNLEELVKEIANDLWQWDGSEISEAPETYQERAEYLIDRIKKELEK